jgi:putative FmdB family regulatory protein
MPIYVFRCPSGHEQELMQRVWEPAPERCLRCGQGPLERVLFAPSVRFYGSGFYATDYGRSRATGGRRKHP